MPKPYYYTEIAQCPTISASHKHAALCCIDRMLTDADFAKRVDFSPNNPNLSTAFSWMESGVGIRVWGDIVAELKKQRNGERKNKA